MSSFVLLFAGTVTASPVVDPGDMAMRHDIQRLADYGVIKRPVSTWPLSWGPILEDLERADGAELPQAIGDSLARVLNRARLETETDQLGLQAEVGFAEKQTGIRSFQDTPRGRVELSAGAEWIGQWFAAELNIQFVDGDPEVDEFRADGSMIGVIVKNWSISANTLERWWGPGWDGSLILSNNARPLPSVTIDRVFNNAFESRWLSWLGPWDMSITFGQMESSREVPDARLFGMRFNFMPLENLEIGLSRTAQWCGSSRPCDGETLVNLLIGKDNRGGEGIEFDNEPGNQLAGIDMRWTPYRFNRSISLYGQFIGEDEAGGFPSRYIGQAGAEWAGYFANRWSTRVFAEAAATSCQFHESSEVFNCAYNHRIYRSGYRYRGRSIGHGADNDARVASVGVVMVDPDNTQWRAIVRYGKLNRGGVPDARNSLTPTPADLHSIDVSHSRELWLGTAEVGLGYESFDSPLSGGNRSDARLYMHWRHLF